MVTPQGAVIGEDRVRRASGAPAIAPGVGKLRFERIAGRTVLTRVFATSPLRLLNPKTAGRAAWACLATYGGGLVSGDALQIDLETGPGTAALVTTQASTKVYRSETVAGQRLHARAAAESLLVLLPDPVTCFAGASYEQDQQVLLDASATLVLVDWLTAGRVESGERWRFNTYSSRLKIWRQDRLILHDALRLTPEDGELARRMDRFNCLASVVLVGPAVRAGAARLAGVIGSAPVSRRSPLLLSAAPVDGDGALVRVAGPSVEQVGVVLRQHLGFVSSLLGDDPWSCRW